MVFLIWDIPFSHTLTHIYKCSVKQLIELIKKLHRKLQIFKVIILTVWITNPLDTIHSISMLNQCLGYGSMSICISLKHTKLPMG